MALHLHRAEDTGTLATELGALLSDPPADPFTTELVLVSARGMERWLSQQLSHVLGCGWTTVARDGQVPTDGVCAGIEFRSPASLLAEISGAGGAGEVDPWDPDALVWPLLEAIDVAVGPDPTGWAATLAGHLGYTDVGDPDERELRHGRRYAVARRVAGLFASYAKARPAMLTAWLAGERTDGTGVPLDPDLHWQPQLWRALTTRINADPPPVRQAKVIAQLRDSPSDLPPRLSLFGHTRLAAADIELLGALATHHDLHLWLPHPSDALWRALSDQRGQIPRAEDTSRLAVHHPLLQTLGRDLRELQRGLPIAQSDQFCPPARPRPDTMLGWLQADIAANQLQPVGARFHKQDDRSVQVHRCHGAARQIDVLRDVLLGLLDEDPTLAPRDILVMCPDIDTYAPLITAAFGAPEHTDHSHPAQGLRVRLADRALTQTNPLLAVLAELLQIAGGRAPASAVLSLAYSEPVRHRFAFTDDDLVTITEWVGATGIRWGFDAEHRAPYQLQQYPQNTWRFGIDRLLTGAAMSDDSQAWLGTALPLDDVDSDRVELAGRFAEYVARLRTVVDRLAGSAPLRHWVDTLRDGTALLTRVSADDLWQQGQLDRELSKVLSEAGCRADTELRLTDVRALLSRRLAGRPTRANFRTGTLTVCTMVPMRSVPHRVVCLVGLDDGVFPRTNIADGDDVLARHPLTGERDARAEDRQLLLDAICSATDTLVITYTGIDEHSGEHRPPAVPLQELLDTVDRTTPECVRDRIMVNHPLQPFDTLTVEPNRLVPHEPFTYDPAALRGARAIIGQRTPKPPFIADALPESPCGDLELTDLLGFFKNPVRGFFRALNYTLAWDTEEVSDAIPVELDGLNRWQVGDRMLTDLMAGHDPDFVIGAEWRRGTLPPGHLGWRQAREINAEAVQLAAAARALQRDQPQRTVDVDIDLADGRWPGRRLTGTIGPLWGNRAVSVTYSKLGAGHRLQAWITLLVLAAGAPGTDWESYCVGRGGRRDPVSALGYPAPPQALSLLADLVAIYDAGCREPLPLPLKASLEWARARQYADDDPGKGAAREWQWEREGPEYVQVWGPAPDLDVLLTAPRPDETVRGETTRLGAYASRLWLPMLDVERRC
jgi:exodeoxyribonuclease V gamma subunit